MIFVTVGTHEQQFNRLVKKIDEIALKKLIDDEIFIQRGYSTYIPEYCESEVLLSFDVMQQYIKESRIILTHGGPCSILQAMLAGKIPIVIPRVTEFGEHVDNHQIEFAKFLDIKRKAVTVYNIDNLEHAILNYYMIVEKLVKTDNISEILQKNVSEFCSKLEAYL